VTGGDEFGERPDGLLDSFGGDDAHEGQNAAPLWRRAMSTYAALCKPISLSASL
jgi:hypothetical protein